MTVVLASVAFWAPVTYRLLGDDGQPETVLGRARYKRLKTSERRALDRRLRANRLTPDLRVAIRKQLDDQDSVFTTRERTEIEADLAAESISDEQFLAATLVDWDFKDKTGQVISYTPAAVRELCEDWDGFEAALVQAYFDNGRKAREAAEVAKNSELPSATTT